MLLISKLFDRCKACFYKSASALILLAAFVTGCSTTYKPGTPSTRTGDEIVVAGNFIHTGTPVVLWLDPGGYDAYRVERRFGDVSKSGWRESAAENPDLTTPNRYGLRASLLTSNQIERVRGGGWDLPLLQTVVDQFVIHFDECSLSRICFQVLQDERDLSVHFMLDVDGTIYQTLDLKERAWHATTSNSRSVGIEVANTGAFRSAEARPLKTWYERDEQGVVTMKIPKEHGDGGIRTHGFKAHPARQELISGNIQGRDLVQYDYTPEQYAALTKLTATLCKVFPKLPCKFPTDASGKLIPHKLADDELNQYQGVMGHYHIQTNKEDPGPAFDWDKVIGGARRLLGIPVVPPGNAPVHGNALRPERNR
jgi:N-acetyl-anhydromuramyl-L-alanine amidase AmpD